MRRALSLDRQERQLDGRIRKNRTATQRTELVPSPLKALHSPLLRLRFDGEIVPATANTFACVDASVEEIMCQFDQQSANIVPESTNYRTRSAFVRPSRWAWTRRAMYM